MRNLQPSDRNRRRASRDWNEARDPPAAPVVLTWVSPATEPSWGLAPQKRMIVGCPPGWSSHGEGWTDRRGRIAISWPLQIDWPGVQGAIGRLPGTIGGLLAWI